MFMGSHSNYNLTAPSRNCGLAGNERYRKSAYCVPLSRLQRSLAVGSRLCTPVLMFLGVLGRLVIRLAPLPSLYRHSHFRMSKTLRGHPCTSAILRSTTTIIFWLSCTMPYTTVSPCHYYLTESEPFITTWTFHRHSHSTN
jgi:hypothetical protein